LITTDYTVSVVDECIGNPVNATATITVPPYIPLEITLTDDIVEICPFVDNQLASEATGGVPGYSYYWLDDDGNDLGVKPVIDVAPGSTTVYTVGVVDNCNDSTDKEVSITVLSPPLILDITPPGLICPGDSIQLTVYPTGGWGDYTYYWPHSGELTQSVWVSPGATTTFFVQVQDSCATFTVETSTEITVTKPIANFWVHDYLMEDLLVTFHNVTINGYTYWWDLGNGETSTDTYPQTTYDEPGYYDITLVAWNEIGCVDTIRKPIRIKPEFYFFAPNAFTPDNDDRFNNYFSVSIINPKSFHIDIFNRWGELIYQSDDPRFKWDGTYQGKQVQDGVYVYKIFLQSINDDFIEHNGHVTVIR
jgi:gliding motility-associated-like protein